MAAIHEKNLLKNPLKNLLDTVILVDEHDHPIGVMDKLEAHRHGARLHRAISVYLFNEQGELLIQQRSQEKIVGAGQWANTVCGNVRAGESYLECAQRRLQEELGLSQKLIDLVALQAIYKFQYAVACNEEFSEREIDQVYVGMVSEELFETFEKSIKQQLNASEVQAIEWVDFAKIRNDKQQLTAQYEVTPWFEVMIDDPNVMDVIGKRLATFLVK